MSHTYSSVKSIILILLLGLSTLALSANNWKPDRYLKGYQEITVKQPNDYKGEVNCTVIRRLSSEKCVIGILYVHGFNDYFFQKEMGDRFVDNGYDFYALDLRKYGRSLRKGQTPYECRDIKEYYPDINSALALMKKQGIEKVVLMGHSTGGLVAASYMNNNPDKIIKALILNSPFLEWNFNGFMKDVAIPVVSWIGGWWPSLSISQGDGTAYAESLLKKYHGEWQFDTNLKTIHPRKVTAGWIHAITEAQRALHNKSAIKCPILLLRSDKSVFGDEWTPLHQCADAVLNVKDISKYGRMLGSDVTEDIVPGGLHDLALSSPRVRAVFYKDIFSWLKKIKLYSKAKMSNVA